MKPELCRFGNSASPVVVIDDFTGKVEDVSRLADVLAPFPGMQSGYYPGVRRVIDRSDREADAYVENMCEVVAQFIAGAFDVGAFELVEASFSIVTAEPTDLSAPQRAPHFDSTDPKYFALLHYLRVPEGSGTAFYRQRSTGIECVTEENVDRFVAHAARNAKMLPPDSGYIQGSDQSYEQIGAVEAVPDRLLIYQGNLLHSGIIPPGMVFSADPREGRLTANLFVRGH